MSPEGRELPSCEKAVQQTGWGLYHYFLVGMASVCAFSQATAFASIPFAVPLAVCDMSLSAKVITIIDTCFSFGIAFGGLIITSASDITGKKCMSCFTLLLIFGSTFASSFAHGSTILILCAFTLGAGIFSNSVCFKIHLGEVLPMETRGFWLAIPDLFWSIGYLLSSTTNWLLTPLIQQYEHKEIRLATWRIIFGLSGACSIMIACAFGLVKPSPRFLLFMKRYPEALDTLKHIYAINSSRHCDTYSIHEENVRDCVDSFSLHDRPLPATCPEQMGLLFRRLRRQFFLLLKKRFLWTTAVLVSIRMVLIFGILAVNIWLAKMVLHGSEPDCYFTAVDILHLEGTQECTFNVHGSLYKTFFLIALNIVLGPIVLLFTADRFGRRASIVGGCITCGVSSFALGYIRNVFVAQVVASSMFMMAYSLVDSALNIVVIEAYPTAFRGTAAGGTQFLARFAGGFMKRFLETPCQYSFIFIGALMLAAAVLGCFLPELRRQAMVE